MPLTNADIRNKLRGQGFPDSTDLPDASYDEAIGEAERRVQWDYPLETYGLFQTVAQQQVYDLFNPVLDNNTQQGVFANGLRALEMVASPGSDDASTDLFGITPFLQGMNIIPGEITSFSFNTPTDFWIWDANWAQFVKRFSFQGFEHVESRPGSPVRIFPVPHSCYRVFTRYTRARTLTEVRDENEQAFFLFCKAEVAKMAARKYRAAAGITVGPYKDDGKTALYWGQEADKLDMQADAFFRDNQFTHTSAVQRT